MSTITLPGMIDPHVHLRDPGQTHKEDFNTGSSAALAGGYTTIIDMPNNIIPITTEKLLDQKISIANKKIVGDLGFYFGTLGDNYSEFGKIYDKVCGMKIYLNLTTGGFIIDKKKLSEIYSAWQSDKPIMLHAEEDVSDLVLTTLKNIPRKTHICHVSSQKELEFVMRAKDMGFPITCGITPHHLFLNDADGSRLGSFGHMKPYLKPEKDRKFLWDHLDGFDIIESDHAPHTRQEKESNNPPFGVPNLETTLSLMLSAEAEGKITRAKLLDKLHFKPAELLRITPDKKTHIEVSMEEYEIRNENLLTKAGWSPFAGRKVVGKVKKVYIRGNKVFENGKVLVDPGSGRIIS